MRSYDRWAAHPLSKAAFHREWSFTFFKLRKLQPKSSSGTASIPSQKGLVGGRNGGGQADSQSFENMNVWPSPSPTMVTKTVNRRPDHWLSVLKMVADFNLTMLTFFLKTGEVPWAPLLQRLRKYLGGKEGDQPPFCAQDLSWTHSRVAWRPNSHARPLPEQSARSPATLRGEQSFSQRCSVLLFLLSLHYRPWDRNKQLKCWLTHS